MVWQLLWWVLWHEPLGPDSGLLCTTVAMETQTKNCVFYFCNYFQIELITTYLHLMTFVCCALTPSFYWLKRNNTELTFRYNACPNISCWCWQVRQLSSPHFLPPCHLQYVNRVCNLQTVYILPCLSSKVRTTIYD